MIKTYSENLFEDERNILLKRIESIIEKHNGDHEEIIKECNNIVELKNRKNREIIILDSKDYDVK